MSITDELREWASVEVPYKYGHQLTAIADRIDAEHESACAEAYGNGVMSVPIALDESAWVELPKDADGKYIHVGDEMCGYGWPNGGVYCRAIVNVATILVGPQDGAYRGWLMWAANECRHHHAPTVEDVLREFICDHEEGVRDEVDLIAEYASKLKLAEGEDA